MLAIQEYNSVLNPVYGIYTARMNSLVSSIYFKNAGDYTGVTAAETHLRSAIADNMANTGSVVGGLSLVESNKSYVADINTKLRDMKELAEEVAGGFVTPAAIAGKQAELEALAEEIDDIAQGPLGETHMLTADTGSESFFIGNGLSITVDTHDMDTTSGLGLGAIDLETDAAAAVNSLEAAIAEVQAYAAHLDSKHDSLQAAASVLEVQTIALTAVESAIESTDAAMIAVGIINTYGTTTANLLLISQANAIADTVLNLLAN